MNGHGIPLRRIGNSDLSVSALGFGAATLGNLYEPLSDDDAAAALAAAHDAGIRYVDTAPYYGFGLSERRVGDALRGRDGAVVSSKVGRLLVPDPAVRGNTERHGFRSALPFRPVFDYSHDGILRSYEDSLQRLGFARIDILYVHDIGALTHGERDAEHLAALTDGGGLRALERLRDEGAIGGVGVGVNEIAACERVMDSAALDVILLAGRYTLLEQPALADLFPRCAATRTSLVIGGPYNSGILATGVGGAGPHYYDYGPAPVSVVDRVRAIEAVCRAHGVPIAAAALQFPLAHPVVASVIPGLRDRALVDRTVALFHHPIPAGLWDDLRTQGLIDPAARTPAPAGRAA